MIVRIRRHPAEAALEPDGLRRVHKRSVAVEAGVYTAVLAIPAVLHPKRHDVPEKFLAALRGKSGPIITFLPHGTNYGLLPRTSQFLCGANFYNRNHTIV